VILKRLLLDIVFFDVSGNGGWFTLLADSGILAKKAWIKNFHQNTATLYGVPRLFG
jgi:hypothetical protein